MKKITHLLMFLLLTKLSSSAWALNLKNNLHEIEIGDELVLKKSLSKVWVENSKHLKVEARGPQAVIKGLSAGVSSVKLDGELTTIRILPTGSVRTRQTWTRLLNKVVGLSLGFCQDRLCIKGTLFRKEDFHYLIQKFNESSPQLYFDITLKEELKLYVQNYFEQVQRDSGLTPYRLNLTSPWKVVVSNKELIPEYQKVLTSVGIDVYEGKQKIELADNVKVSIKIAEVKKSFSRTLGIKPPDSYSAQLVDTNWFGQSDIVATLHASETSGDVKILASPQLLCRSGKEAEFFAGGEIPIKVLGHKSKEVIWKKHGIFVKFKPVVDAVGQMSLSIDSEVSSLDGQFSVDGIPAIHSHKVSSHFDLIRSKTIALSGLLKTETGRTSSGWPWLSKIPILGTLFSSKNYLENQSELVVFVTPELTVSEN